MKFPGFNCAKAADGKQVLDVEVKGNGSEVKTFPVDNERSKEPVLKRDGKNHEVKIEMS